MTGGRAPKDKGSKFERDVADYLRTHGHPNVERAYGAGRPEDIGDLDGLPEWCFELKAENRLDLATAANELETEMYNAGAEWGAHIHKRRGRPVAQAYVVMPLWQFAVLIGDTP